MEKRRPPALSQAQSEAQRFRRLYDERNPRPPQEGAQAPVSAPMERPSIPSPDAPQEPGMIPTTATPTPMTFEAVIGEKEIIDANRTLEKYRSGKANLEARVIEAEQWWKRRHWEYMINPGNENDRQPASAWLFNCIMSKHADGIEAFPEPNIRPREPGDKEEAKKLTSIVPVVLEQNDFEETYSAQLWQKLKQGTGIYGIFWDKSKMNGLGDIAIRKMDVLNIFWEPGITSIQESRNIFTTELVATDLLREMYGDKLGDRAVTGKAVSVNKYLYDDNVDTTDKAIVVDWYYHKRVKGRKVLHYVKYVDSIVLYATENDPEWRDRGLYDHALFPFVFDALFPIEGSPCGHGYVDIGKNAQGSIDRLGMAIEKSAVMGATPRFFIRGEGGLNEEEFADWTKTFVHVTNSQLGEDSIREIKIIPVSETYNNILNNKILELKETTGNRDANTGGSSPGVTAASAIAALQEQAGKTSKASTKSAYRAYGRLIDMVIELIRQFYDLPRQYRIIGDNGTEEFVSFSNANIQPQQQGAIGGMDMGYRLPVFDVDVSAQKMTAYTKMQQNELAVQFFQMGFFNPAQSDVALTTLDMMDFAHKDIVEDKIRKNGTMYQLLAQYQQMALALAAKTGDTQTVEMIAQNIAQTQQGLSGSAPTASPAPNLAAGDATTGTPKRENKIVENSRARSQAASQPNA